MGIVVAAVVSGVVIMVVVMAAVMAVVMVVTVAMLRARRRRSRPGSGAPLPPPGVVPPRVVPPPMTGLESALASVTDRDGRPIRERIDAESVHVDPLRDPNDTGPLLRRALDSVEHHGPAPRSGPVADERGPSDA